MQQNLYSHDNYKVTCIRLSVAVVVTHTVLSWVDIYELVQQYCVPERHKLCANEFVDRPKLGERRNIAEIFVCASEKKGKCGVVV